MVRTRADGASRKAVAAKAPRKSLGSSSSGASSSMSSPSGKGNKYGGGNPVCPRPTPDWQKGIGAFLVKSPERKEKENRPGDANEIQEIGESSTAACSSSCSQGSSSSEGSSGYSAQKNGIVDSDDDE